MGKRFLIGQLACFGDCLLATPIARQIKLEDPTNHVTWAIGARYKSILEGNPFVDEVWEVPLPNGDYFDKGWKPFEKMAMERSRAGVYDKVIFSQIPNRNWKNFDGTIRSSILRGYSAPIQCSVTPVLRLTDKEINNVRAFSKTYSLATFKNVILFECAPQSGQSSMTPDFALRVAREITQQHPDTAVILSTPKSMATGSPKILDASVLTFRENAELAKYCTLLLGCSSGISWISTSDAAKQIPMVQLVNPRYGIFAGLAYDFIHWGMDTSHIIEIHDQSKDKLSEIVDAIQTNGFSDARIRYHKLFKPNTNCVRAPIRFIWKEDRSFRSFKKSFCNIFHRNSHFEFWGLLWTYLGYFLCDSYWRRIEKFIKKRQGSLAVKKFMIE